MHLQSPARLTKSVLLSSTFRQLQMQQLMQVLQQQEAFSKLSPQQQQQLCLQLFMKQQQQHHLLQQSQAAHQVVQQQPPTNISPRYVGINFVANTSVELHIDHKHDGIRKY